MPGSGDCGRDGIYIDNEGRMGLPGGTEGLFDAHVKFAVRAAHPRDHEPAAATGGEQRGFGQFRRAENSGVERPHAVFDT